MEKSFSQTLKSIIIFFFPFAFLKQGALSFFYIIFVFYFFIKFKDIIRFVELTGNLSYNTNLVIRALPVNNTAVAIQGDTTGTRLVAGSGTSLLAQAYDGGELVVQTRNAAFGLLYVGNTDAPNDPNASEIPSNLRGWWLVEL